MRIDMHFNGLYWLLRACGLDHKRAEEIARACQFVDDNKGSLFADYDIKLPNGYPVETIDTAHHPADVRNLSHWDQVNIWVPFHFLPGLEKDNPLRTVAGKMPPFSLFKSYDVALGPPFHRLMDTFAHDGFSGVSSEDNLVDQDSLQIFSGAYGRTEYGRLADFFRKHTLKVRVMGAVADTFGALGHGGVGTLPDLPYARYAYETRRDGYPVTIERNNPEIYLKCCDKICLAFGSYLTIPIRDRVKKEILERELPDKEDRAALWNERAPDIFDLPRDNPEYRLPDPDHAPDREFLIKFFRAARIARNEILDKWLPANGVYLR